MNPEEFFKKVEIEKVAYEIGKAVIEGDPYLREGGIKLDEFDDIDIIVMGLDHIGKSIDILMQDMAHAKREGQ